MRSMLEGEIEPCQPQARVLAVYTKSEPVKQPPSGTIGDQPPDEGIFILYANECALIPDS